MHNSSDLLCNLEISNGMDLKRLRTFVTVAELGTVSRAALRLAHQPVCPFTAD